MDDKRLNFQLRTRNINLILHFLKFTILRIHFKIIYFNKVLNFMFIITTNNSLIFLILVYYEDMKDTPCLDDAKNNKNVYSHHI